MLIFVFGNLNVGKTSFCLELKDKLPSFHYLSLDSYRKKYSDGTIFGENLANGRFVCDVEASNNAIVEFTGYGPVANNLRERLRIKCGIMIVCERDIVDAVSSLNLSKYAAIPYPDTYKQNQSLKDTIFELTTLTTRSSLELEWQSHLWQSYTFRFNEPFKTFWGEFPFLQHQWVENINDLVSKKDDISAAVLFGSAGANKLTISSDVDFFIETQSPASYWYQIFTEHFVDQIVHSDLIDTKITLRTEDGLLIEISVGRQLIDLELYYRESNIHNHFLSLFKGDTETMRLLEWLSKKVESIQSRSSRISAQAYFLFCSLPKLISSNDTYKYVFHTVIIQRNAIQLEHLLLGIIEHNYLPKHAAERLPFFPWQCFNINGSCIQKTQYQELYDYLELLFARLASQGLIASDKYFTKATKTLHCID